LFAHRRTLTERIQQLEDKKGDVATERKALEKKLDDERSNQEDIFEYLRGEIHNKNNQITELQEKNMALVEDQERLAQEFEQQQQAANDQAMEAKATMMQEISRLKDDLNKVKTFISLKAEMEADLAEKTRLLKENAKDHRTSLADLERKHVQEKDRLKKEMLFKLRETKAKLLQMTDNQLDTTTKRTIAENEQMSSELAWQSRETEKLIRRNDKLMGENAALNRELGLHKQMQEDFAKKVNVYQKTIKTLLAKLNLMDASQQAELQRIHLEDDEKERDKAETLREREGLEDGLAEASALLNAAQQEIMQLQAVLAEVEGKYAGALDLQDEAVKFALQCLVDIKERHHAQNVFNDTRAGRIADVGTSEDQGGGQGDSQADGASLSTLDVSAREEVMTYLLEQLQAYQNQLKELELHSAWKQHTAQHSDQIGPPLTLPPIAQHGGSGGVQRSSATVWAVNPPPIGGAIVPQRMGEMAEGQVVMPVNAPLRPYGKRAGPARGAAVGYVR
jgi:hypothetical protein